LQAANLAGRIGNHVAHHPNRFTYTDREEQAYRQKKRRTLAGSFRKLHKLTHITGVRNRALVIRRSLIRSLPCSSVENTRRLIRVNRALYLAVQLPMRSTTAHEPVSFARLKNSMLQVLWNIGFNSKFGIGDARLNFGVQGTMNCFSSRPLALTLLDKLNIVCIFLQQSIFSFWATQEISLPSLYPLRMYYFLHWLMFRC
jgi:hypothetical protein